MATIVAIAKEIIHNTAVVRVLALISSMKSASGIATTINQSRPQLSLRGSTSSCMGRSLTKKVNFW